MSRFVVRVNNWFFYGSFGIDLVNWRLVARLSKIDRPTD